jgi:hypothetical protein
MAQIASRSSRHGSYVANSVDVRDYVTAYYGDVNQSYKALVAFVISAAGFGDWDYWSDMEAIDLLVVLADVRKGDVSALTSFMAAFDEDMDIRIDEDEFDRKHFHHMWGRDIWCEYLTHCPSICDCEIDQCDSIPKAIFTNP